MEQQEALGRLEVERDRLENLRDENAGTDWTPNPDDAGVDGSTQGQHHADTASESATKEADLALLESIDAELRDVEHALKRIDAGSYGTCEACSKPIGDDRLEAVPAARFCIDDQHLAAREGGRSQDE